MLILFFILCVALPIAGLTQGCGPAIAGFFGGLSIWLIIGLFVVVGHAYDCTDEYDRNGGRMVGDCA